MDRTAAKAAGRNRYAADFDWPDLWSAVVIRSPHPRARVRAIDAAEALACPEVERLFTAADVPDRPFATGGHPLNVALPGLGAGLADKKLLTDRPRHQGDEVAVLVARSLEAAERAAELLRVDYEAEASAGSIAAALDEDAWPVNPDFKDNVFFKTVQESGRAVDDLLASGLTVAGEFSTQVMQHVPLETPAAVAWLDDRQRLVLVSSTQVPHLLPRLIGRALDWPESRIRVVKAQVGGGFGCKQDLHLEPLAAWLSLRLGGRPIRLIQRRSECFLASRTRHAFSGKGRAAVDERGSLSALELEVRANIGAYAAHGHTIAAAAGAKLPALYPGAAIRYRAESVFSNIAVAGAFRGFGFPQVAFMAESLVDEAALAAGRDPLECRLENVARPGDRNQLDGSEISPAAIYECLQRGREAFQWDRRKAEAAECLGPVRRGVGVACFCYTTGTYPFYPEAAGARLTLKEDGNILAATGAVEIGQGADEAVALLTARALNLEPRLIEVVSGQDTYGSPYQTGAYASRQTAVTAEAIFRAGAEFKERLLALAGDVLGLTAEALDLEGGCVVERGGRRPRLSLRQLAETAYYHPELGAVITAEQSVKVRRNQAVYGCSLVDLEVDLPLCRVKVNELLNVHDSGSIVDQRGAEGQVYGGQVMGLAMALGEELLFDASGRVRNNSLLDYKLPLAGDVGRLSCLFVEQGSFEPRSLGEAPCIPVAAAVGNALRAATGLRLTSLPFSPPRLRPHFSRINFGL